MHEFRRPFLEHKLTFGASNRAPAPAPKVPCVTGWICSGSGPRRDRRIRPSSHVANQDSAKLTLIINTAMTISAGM